MNINYASYIKEYPQLLNFLQEIDKIIKVYDKNINYEKYYIKLILNAKLRPESTLYMENHHIILEAFFFNGRGQNKLKRPNMYRGWMVTDHNLPVNIVRLFPEEHFLAHALLMFIWRTKKNFHPYGPRAMAKVANAMINFNRNGPGQERQKIDWKEYGELKRLCGAEQSKKVKGIPDIERLGEDGVKQKQENFNKTLSQHADDNTIIRRPKHSGPPGCKENKKFAKTGKDHAQTGKPSQNKGKPLTNKHYGAISTRVLANYVEYNSIKEAMEALKCCRDTIYYRIDRNWPGWERLGPGTANSHRGQRAGNGKRKAQKYVGVNLSSIISI